MNDQTFGTRVFIFGKRCVFCKDKWFYGRGHTPEEAQAAALGMEHQHDDENHRPYPKGIEKEKIKVYRNW